MAGSLDISTVNLISPNGLNTTVLSTSDADKFVVPKAVDLTSGQIKFPATQVASSDANTLDDYEEGTWTPTDISGAGLVFTVSNARYIKVGRLVHCSALITFPTTSDTKFAMISLPILNVGHANGYFGFTSYGSSITYLNGNIYSSTGNPLTNANFSQKQIYLAIVYISAD